MSDNYQGKLSFAKAGADIIGFIRTELDVDQVASRKQQSDLIRQYASQRGFKEPFILPTAKRADLYKQATKGCILVTSRLSNLLRRPSDVDELLMWTAGNAIKLHVLDMGGEITDRLGVLRQVSECYAPLERDVEAMRKQAADTEQHHAEVLKEAIGRVVQTLTAKFMGLRSEVQDITDAAKAAVDSPLLRERRAQAAQMIAAKQERTRQLANAEQWHAAQGTAWSEPRGLA